jgi:hypothetical protein
MNLNHFRFSSSIAAITWCVALPLSLASSLAIAPAAHARPAPSCVTVTADLGHAPARHTYEKVGFELLPIARYFKKL